MQKELIYIGSEHGGYLLKQAIKDCLDHKGIPYKDVGSNSAEIVRYPTYAEAVAVAVSEHRASKGILICSTGIGMSIVANRFKGVRASLCTDSYMGRITRAHNDSNILCLGGKITGELEALDILENWLSTEFEGGRHSISLGMIEALDNDRI